MKEVLKYYKDFPKQGIVFVDIIPFLQNKTVFKELTAKVAEACTAPNIIAPEARGFLFAAPLLTNAEHVENIVPVRKSGKLPFAEGDLKEVVIEKEYGSDKLYYRISDIAVGKANGENIEVTGSGLLAKAFCHEIDHLDGKLYVDQALKIETL